GAQDLPRPVRRRVDLLDHSAAADDPGSAVGAADEPAWRALPDDLREGLPAPSDEPRRLALAGVDRVRDLFPGRRGDPAAHAAVDVAAALLPGTGVWRPRRRDPGQLQEDLHDPGT